MIKLNEKSWLIVLAAICLVYISLRFWRLTDSCLWFDEIFSIHAAELGLQNLFWFAARDLIHPPLFYVLLKFWISVGGESLFWLRFFPVLFSIIAIIPFYLLSRQLKLNFPIIALALTFLAVNGSLIKYSQEVRMYSLLLCLSLFSMWLFARFLNVGKGIWFLTIVNILLFYTQYFGWFIVLTEVFAVLFLQRIKIRQILIMFGSTAIGFVPWFLTIFQASKINADVSQNLGWAGKPNLPTLFQFLFDLFEPFYYQASSIDVASIYFISVPILLIVIAAFVFYFLNRKAETDKEKNAFYFLLIFIATPILLALIASWILPFSVWGTRHLIIVFAPLAVLSAKVLNKIKISQVKTILSASIFLLFGIAFWLQIQRGTTTFIWCAWENLAVNLHETEQDAPTKIYVFEDEVAYLFWFNLRDLEKNFQIIKVSGIPGLKEDTAYFLPRGFNAVQTTDVNGIGGNKFWIAFRDTDLDYLKPPLQTFLEKGYKIGEPKVFEAQGLKAFLVVVEKGK
ncbi:hypothetical protein BH24ACI2_BH24ACI2_08830 [soil metagenome]